MKLTVELIPKSSWDNNLRSYLTSTQWDKVRRKCYQEAGYKCEICEGVGPKHPVECHEKWDFVNGQVKLFGLIALCPACHEVKHIGRAVATGNEKRALAHFMKVNQMSKADSVAYINEAFDIWRNRSRYPWKLEISYLEEYMGESFVEKVKEAKLKKEKK